MANTYKQRIFKAKTKQEAPKASNRISAQETADIINNLIIKSQELLSKHPININREKEGRRQANSIWPWSGGYRPCMQTLQSQYKEINSGISNF